jgi:hypothetical protein
MPPVAEKRPQGKRRLGTTIWELVLTVERWVKKRPPIPLGAALSKKVLLIESLA